MVKRLKTFSTLRIPELSEMISGEAVRILDKGFSLI